MDEETGKKKIDIYTIAAKKGGTAKTTTAAALIAAAAMNGKRVLSIDLDPQGSLSYILDAKAVKKAYFLNGDISAIIPVKENIDCVPACPELQTEQSYRGSARRLAAVLDVVKQNYDLIVIDTPPTSGELQFNALQAATGLIIPLQADIFNLQGLYQTFDIFTQFKQNNADLSLKGYLITKYDGRTTLARQLKEQIIVKASAMGIPYLGTIRQAAAVMEAAALQRSIFDYAPKSKPAEDYRAFYEALSF